MALNIGASFPQQTTAPSAGYPYGSAQNITVSGDNTGTPFNKTTYDDILGFQQALLDAAGIVPSGVPDQVGASQYVDAINALVVAGGVSTRLIVGNNPLTAITYTSADHNKYETLTNGAAIMVTLGNASAPFGDTITVEKGVGSGSVTFTGDVGVTVEVISGGTLDLTTDGEVGSLVSKDANTWKLIK